MATAKQEFVARKNLDQRHPRKVGGHKPNHSLRGHRHLVTLSEEELSRREQGWNDRFAIDPPPKSNKVPSPAHSPAFSTPPTPLTKESRIQNERAQYGKRGGMRNRASKKPSSGKLIPLGTLSKPSSEAAQPTKEEKLRFKVLKAIDARETLLYQLSALILCTAVQESLFIPSRPAEPPTTNNAGRQQMRSRGGMALAPTPLGRHGGNPGAMTNAREATKLAQQIATDLQVIGIQCVEALVEWMLEAGAQAETPPPFLWRGRNYFLKMFSDLDFAEAELLARGINLDCFKQRNPLLIKPNQKFGRVLAAHSIIMEMIEFAKDMTPMELLAQSGRMRDSGRDETEANNPMTHISPPVDEVSRGAEPETLGTTCEPGPDTEQHSSRSNASVNNQPEYDNSFDADGDEVDGKDEACVDVQPTQDAPAVSKSTAPDQTAPSEDSTHDTAIIPPASPEEPSTSRTEDISAAEYENSFDDDANEEKATTDIDAGTTVTIPDSAITADGPPTIDNVPRIPGMQPDKHLQDPEDDQPEIDDPQATSKRLENELKRWTFLEDENRPTEVNARVCLTWHSTRTLRENLERHSSVSECMEGSIISMVEQYGLAAQETPLKSLLCSDVAQELELASHLVEECQTVLNDICSFAAEAIQTSLGLKNSLVSEIEIQEVLETTEAVRLEYHHSTWDYLKIASTLLVILLGADNDALPRIKNRSPASAGLSRLVKVFYPYLVNQPREELSDNWHPVSSLLAAMGLPTDCLYILLDPICKTLLLAVKLCSRLTQDSQDEGDLAVFPKVNVVCDREDVLQSSVESVWRTHLSSEKTIPSFSLFPFFKSSFGEKLVDGVQVEEGEGKGPLKEWLTLVGTQLASKWRRLSTSKVLVEADATLVTASGNTVIIPGASDVIRPGFQLEWETSEGETIRRVVNKSMEDNTFLLDRSVPPHSFVVSQLRISQPTTAIFEYVQGSESYWLNENTCDSPETRNVLVFVGWFLASAIAHFSSIQLRIHPLFFRLLMNPEHCVTLEEVQLFDPQLFKSLSRMKDMKTSDFVAFLKFEGADESLSVEAYISKVLEEKFGPASGIGWQLEVIRRGFARVIGIDQLERAGITETDLVESICGSSGGPEDDFVINEVFRVAADSDFTDCLPLKNVFWQTVNGFEPQLKRKFIRFVTGVDTLPLAGTEFLRIEMPFTAILPDDHKKCLQMLPQAHTCDNTLELPNYWKALCWREQQDDHKANIELEEELALLLSKKLRDAVEYSSGYGLDGTSAVAGVLTDKSEVNTDHLAKEESYDSLGLPALSEGRVLVDDSPSSPQTLSVAELEEAASADEPESKPAELSAVDASPRPEESYEDDYDDWEEESMA